MGGISLDVVILTEVVRHNLVIFVEFGVSAINRQFDESLPYCELERDADKALEQSQCPFWVLICQCNLLCN